MEKDHYYSEIADFEITYVDRILEQKKEPTIHYHNVFELDLFIQSDNECFLKDIRYPLPDGSMLFVRPRDMHIFHYKLGSRYTRFVVSFSEDFLRPYLELQGLGSYLDEIETTLTTLPSDTYSRILPYFLSLYRHRINAVHHQPNQRAAILQAHLLVLFHEVYLLLKQCPTSLPTTKPASIVRDVIQLIEKSYAEPITLELLQETFFVDKFYLCHIFKKETGVPIMEYLNCRRILESQKLLMNTQLPVSDICFSCGFNNLQHFYRTFKKFSPYPPKQYRLPRDESKE